MLCMLDGFPYAFLMTRTISDMTCSLGLVVAALSA